MQSFSLYARDGAGLSDAELRAALAQSLEGRDLRRVLLLPCLLYTSCIYKKFVQYFKLFL